MSWWPMSGWRHIIVTAAISVATAATILVVVCALPHDRYLRFKSLSDPDFVKFGWIYERIHFDQRPIDIAFIGSSRAMLGVNSALVERSFARTSGENLNVVNFSHTWRGRDVDYLIVRELLQNRRPGLLVIEVQEVEAGRLHPAFDLLADVGDIWNAPMLVNTSYFSDFARLPARQFSLFARTYASQFVFGDSLKFSASKYRGSHWDNPSTELGTPERPPILHNRTLSEAALELDRQNELKQKWVPNKYLPFTVQETLRRLEPRANLVYLARLLDLARGMGIPIRFLYLPSWRVGVLPEFGEFYRKYAPIWYYPGDLDRVDWWYDSVHLNRSGSIALSGWLGERVAEELQEKRLTLSLEESARDTYGSGDCTSGHLAHCSPVDAEGPR